MATLDRRMGDFTLQVEVSEPVEAQSAFRSNAMVQQSVLRVHLTQAEPRVLSDGRLITYAVTSIALATLTALAFRTAPEPMNDFAIAALWPVLTVIYLLPFMASIAQILRRQRVELDAGEDTLIVRTEKLGKDNDQRFERSAIREFKHSRSTLKIVQRDKRVTNVTVDKRFLNDITAMLTHWLSQNDATEISTRFADAKNKGHLQEARVSFSDFLMQLARGWGAIAGVALTCVIVSHMSEATESWGMECFILTFVSFIAALIMYFVANMAGIPGRIRGK